MGFQRSSSVAVVSQDDACGKQRRDQEAEARRETPSVRLDEWEGGGERFQRGVCQDPQDLRQIPCVRPEWRH